MSNDKNRPTILKFNIKYVDTDNIEHILEVRPKDLGIDIAGLNKIKQRYINKEGKLTVYENPYPIRDINYWFFLVSAYCKNSKDLANYLVSKSFEYHKNVLMSNARNRQMAKSKDEQKAELKAQESAKRFDDKVKNANKIKELKEITLRLSDSYMKAYHTSDYSLQTGDGNEISIPILYSDTYLQSNCYLPQDEINKKPFQLFIHPIELITSRDALVKCIKRFLNVDESNLSAQDIEFRKTMKRYISKYLYDNLNASKEHIFHSPEHGDSHDLIERINKKLILRRSLINNNKDLDQFILDVLNDAEDNLLIGCYKDGSINFYVFITNFITQLKTHELSKAVDKFETRKYAITDGSKKYKDGFFEELHQKSLEEVFIREENNYHNQLLSEVNENKTGKTYESVTNELLDYYRIYYPDLTDEEIYETFIKPDNETDIKRSKGIK
ncbi:MAG: hypothetical protein J5634_03575 [Bacilli bacterium]|nr:hypothetical protein [Bacilli bacterium]